MSHRSIVKGIFFITFLSVIYPNPITDMCNLNCEGSDTVSVCVLDKSSVCFETFPSKCIMESIKCLFQKDYLVMHDSYCQLIGFQCVNEPWPKIQSSLVEETHPYPYNENPLESVEVVYRDIDNYEIGDETRNYIGEAQSNKSVEGDTTYENNVEDT